MLFTNKTLEIFIDKDGDKKLELYNLYGDETVLSVADKMNSKILFVQDNVTHKYLTLTSKNDGLTLENKKNDKVHIILDLLDYKHFKTSSKIESVSGGREVNFKLIKELRFKNRFKSHWTISILETEDSGFGILKMTSTSGRVSYLIINDKQVMITSFRGAKLYIKDNDIDFDIEKTKWIIER